MKVLKRDGKIDVYNFEKIKRAVESAYNSVNATMDEKFLQQLSGHFQKLIDKRKDPEEPINIEEIQDEIEKFLVIKNKTNVVKHFMRYREDRSRHREMKSKLMKGIASKLQAKNISNQNANVDESSFGGRMGEATRVVTKEYALYNCMSKMARENHLNNEIYIHDLDSYAVGMHNCYDSSTKFITNDGVKRFGDCTDGQVVTVVDKDGNWRTATVKKYGKQKMYDLTFTSSQTTKTVTCTRNHRWVLENGTITDNIQVGDSLYIAKEISNNFLFNRKLWCFGFVLGDGSDFKMYSKDNKRVTNNGMSIRLCGKKNEFKDLFLKEGWSIRHTHSNGDTTLITRGNGSYKQNFLNGKMWNVLSYNDKCNLFKGYLDADGHFKEHGSVAVSTSDERIKEMIEDISSVCGYYVWSKHTKHNSTNYKENRILYEFYLVKKQSTKWTLTSISASRGGENGHKVAWCVEEPETHTFTLDGAMVTGNCLTVPFDDVLSKGFKTRNTDVRPANSINTAMQLVAVVFQLQSLQQFGGVSASHLDWTMVPYVRKSFYKHFKDGLKYCEDETIVFNLDNVENVSIEDDVYKCHGKAYKYAMDMTFKEAHQAVEGMYHNLNTLQSRSGNQLPFTSINYGTCTLIEGRMIIKELLEVSMEGLGANGVTSIFPCGIFQCMKGVNRKPGEPNYDLFRLALKSTTIRIYPNYANVDWSGNAGYEKNDPKTYFSTMGCHAKDTAIIMYDGTKKMVQDIIVGDKLMGLDGQPRTVQSLIRGNDRLFKVNQSRGMSYVVNEGHILALEFFFEGNYVNTSLHDYMNLPEDIRMHCKGYKRLGNNEKSTLTIEEVEPGDFYGFELDGDRLYMLEDGTVTHNCRTANGADINAEEGVNPQTKDGRGNICPVTIILPSLAMMAKEEGGDIVDNFMSLLDKKIGEAKEMLIERFNYICSQSPCCAKFMYENGTMMGYKPEEGIKSALRHGTLAMGQLGLAECLQILIGTDQTEDRGMELAKRIEQLFNTRCAEYKKRYKLNFGVYYTPAENLCYTAMKKFKAKYGVIPNVSDRDFFTNSMHVPVWRDVDAFRKIEIESELTGYSNAGCITYVEVPSKSSHNIDAMEELVNFAMDKDIPYFAINLPIDTCQDCYYRGEIKDVCPKCGGTKISRLARVTGYLSTDVSNFNKGKQSEVKERVDHFKN